MIIYLIGFMGSGKSTIGKALAASENMEYVDLDAYIEAKEGQSIASIFATKGENWFREIERMYLLEAGKRDNCIISVGGGAPCFFDNIDAMNQNGLTIYLQMSANALLERLWSLPPSARASRPLLAGKSKEELQELISAMLEKRAPFYSKARMIVENESNDPKIVIDRIAMAIKHII